MCLLMEKYYSILEVSPQASFEEIKSAYRSLCQEYHPDKLPAGTPVKARKYVEERFKQISEAYSILSDPEKRKEYDLSDPFQESTIATEEKTIFDSKTMNQVAEKLNELKNKIELEYGDCIKEADLLSTKQLEDIGYKEEDLQVITIQKKNLNTSFIVLWIFAGLLLIFIGNIFLKIIGILITIIAAISLFQLIFKTPIVSNKNYLKVEEIKRKIEKIKNQGEEFKRSGKEKRDRELDLIVSHQRQRIKFFNSILIQDLCEDYVAELSDEDQFYLLKSIQERKNIEELKEGLLTTAKVAAVGIGVGIVALDVVLNTLKY